MIKSNGRLADIHTCRYLVILHSDDNDARIAIISNPNSGANKKLLTRINSVIDQHPLITHYITRSADEIPEVLSTISSQGIQKLAINGGDGTTAHIFTCILQQRIFKDIPSIILLPGGTTNMNVGDVGIRGNLFKGIKHLASFTQGVSPETVYRPVLNIQQGIGQKTINGMFFGAGAIIQGIEFCHNKLHSRGVGNEIGPGIAMIRTIWGIIRNDNRYASPVKMKIVYSNESHPVECEALIFLSSTLERLFLGMHPYWNESEGSTYSTLIKANPDRFVRALPFLLAGKPTQRIIDSDCYISNKTQSIELHMDSAYTLDGEIYHATTATGPVTITASQPLRFLR